MNITVVGRGLAGSWVARAARARGHDVTVVSRRDRPVNTATAIALLRSSHLPPEDRPMLEPSLALHEESGAEVLRGAVFTRWDRDDEKFQKDWRTVDPTNTCLPADEFVDSDDEVRERWDPRTTVWCTAEEGELTYGGTWVHPSSDALELPFRVHMLAPYKVVAGVQYGSGARIGSSSATTFDKAHEQAHKLFTLTRDRGWHNGEGWDLVMGTRRKLDPFMRIRWTHRGLEWGGFHRTGFGVAPAEAHRVVDLLELS